MPSATCYLGKGKLDELVALKDNTNYNLVIFDDELSPLQHRNLEEALQVKVIDRAALILDIFYHRLDSIYWLSFKIVLLLMPCAPSFVAILRNQTN